MPPTTDTRTNPLIWVAVAAVAVAAVLAVALSSPGEPDLAPGGEDAPGAASVEVADPGAVSVTGTPLPSHTPGADGAVGAPVPTLGGPGLDGQPRTVVAAGRPTVIAVVAHWCPHCQAELPQIAELRAGDWPDGVDLVVLSTAQNRDHGNWPPSRWFTAAGVDDADVVVDDADATLAAALGTTAFPYLVGVDADGTLRWRTVGSVGAAELTALTAALTDPAAPTVTIER